MTEKTETKTENKEKKPHLSTDTALWILFGVIAVTVVFLLTMRFIERKGISPAVPSDFVTEIYEITEEETTDNEKININTASAAELMCLPGIGKTKAEAIINHIKENGKIHNREELLEVKGLGEKTVDKFIDMIEF